jgi:hypothetical protein
MARRQVWIIRGARRTRNHRGTQMELLGACKHKEACRIIVYADGAMLTDGIQTGDNDRRVAHNGEHVKRVASHFLTVR